MNKEDLKSKSLRELEKIGATLGFPDYKARSVFHLIHSAFKDEISLLTGLSLLEREALAKKHYISKLMPAQVLTGKEAEKLAFALEDGNVVEAVRLKSGEERNTVCISCQVGCPVGCQFCATGQMEFKRNLTVGEILSQVYYFAKQGEVSNIVFMGMGEPLLNYNNVIKAARILNHAQGLNIAARKIVISTIGITAGIKKLAEESEQFRLAWSLVAPFDYTRREITAIQSLESIDKIVQTIRAYQAKTKRRVSLEYVVIKDLSDQTDQVTELIGIAKKFDCHVNLIAFNPHPYADYEPGDVKKVYSRLQRAGINVTIRKSLGADVQGACGQLFAKKV